MAPLLLAWLVATEAAVPGTNSEVWGVVGIGSGWAIVGIFVLMVFQGKVGTKRELDAYDQQIAYQRETIDTLNETVANFTVAIEASTAMIRAVLDVAQDRRSS